MKTPANYSHGPHTDADYGVSTTPPPSVIYRRNQMRRTAWEIAGCFVMFLALVTMAVMSDPVIVRAQMEDVQ